jgi:hypothetical protein
MKYVGFFQEISTSSRHPKFETLNGEKSPGPGWCRLEPDVCECFVQYLEEGSVISAFMGFFPDVTGESYSSVMSYYTDGEYIWPSYFPFYLKKYESMWVDRDFFDHVQKRAFKSPALSKDEKQRIQNRFLGID